MEIRKSEVKDLDILMDIFSQAREFMALQGNPHQWGDGYPKKELIEADIKSGCSYVCTEGEKILGTFYFRVGSDPFYGKIYDGAWMNEEPYGVVHRVATGSHKKGVASFCLNWCFKQFGNIRIDTLKDNIPMQGMLEKNGFKKCGTIILDENGDTRIAFQKTK